MEIDITEEKPIKNNFKHKIKHYKQIIQNELLVINENNEEPNIEELIEDSKLIYKHMGYF